MAGAIYLDHHATTPVDPAVLEAMLPWFTENPGNPHSRHHEHGWSAEAAVDIARMEIARLINAPDEGVYFTSGATESNNWAIRGMLGDEEATPGRILVSAVEHPCVLAGADASGCEVLRLPVETGGGVDPGTVEAELKKGRVRLVSVMLANNEIGTIQPVAAIARMAREAGAWVHCDAAQAVGRIPVDMERLGVDLMSMTAHKFYGPKGIGALAVRGAAQKVLRPLIRGGGQQADMRSGTVPTPLAVGFGAAAELAGQRLDAERKRIGGMRNRLWSNLTERADGLHLNGAEAMRLPGNLNFHVDGADADDIIRAAPEIAISTGSACSSASSAPSHVLAAIGLDEEQTRGSLRIGVGRMNTDDDIQVASDALIRAIEKARAR